MASEFGVSTQMVANSLPAYFLGLALGQLIYVTSSDRIGRKPPLYFGLALFSLANMLCVFAQNEWGLIAARILQALGGCVGVVIARAAIRDQQICKHPLSFFEHDDCDDHCAHYRAYAGGMGT